MITMIDDFTDSAFFCPSVVSSDSDNSVAISLFTVLTDAHRKWFTVTSLNYLLRHTD